MGRRKFLLKKCPADCGEKGAAVVVRLLVPRVLQEMMELPPSSVAVFVLSNIAVLSHVFVCMSILVAAPL